MKHIIFSLFISVSFLGTASAELNDQGLNSIISIIDKAIESLEKPTDDSKDEKTTEESQKAEADVSNSTLVGMARTLGKLSFSRLQCGEANVLGEFTKRVQLVPEAYQNLMRSAFQEGFDKSKASSKLLSEDECKRLTASRQIKAKTAEDKVAAPKQKQQKEVVEKPKVEEDPSLKHMRLAHMAGQFAYKKKYCGDKKIITKDFNEIISNMPKDIQAKGKKSYWKGYQQGKRMNKNLTQESC